MALSLQGVITRALLHIVHQNLGTGMRASIHVNIPTLTSAGMNAKVKEVSKPLGLSVQVTGGEHNPLGADGIVTISPSARIFIKEKEIIGKPI